MTSWTTSNAAGVPQDLVALRVAAVLDHLRRYRSSTMLRHRLRRVAWHLAQQRTQRGRLDFYHGLLDAGRYRIVDENSRLLRWSRKGACFVDEKIKVTDKRMFTAEGELREDYRGGEGGPDAPADSSDSGQAKESPPAQPRSAEPEAQDLATAEPPTQAPRTERGAPDGELSPPTFMDLIGLLAQPIAMFLGDASMPGGQAEKNLPLARFHIDLLDLVQTKTKGNISSEEAKLLEGLLYQMRMRYVKKAG